MTSSTSGDRRWGTARRSGMTVLGKVAVPKPINLPSQRLENQGLDPNVEIVPKGTLSWGSKSSLNAWGSSSLSPRTDSGAGSPSHLSNRPSSGGTGTRPSTSGSEKGHETSANAWGSNSRPSSASGVLPSNQASLGPLRPRSAETRPSSSQLSRFAEVVPENLASWNQGGTAEKLGLALAKNDGFSLSSGDFPSLGSAKESSGRSTGLKDHGPQVCPSSSSGRSAAEEDRAGNSIEDASARSDDINSWRRNNQPFVDDGPRHGIEEMQIDSQGPQPYPNANFPSHHFDTWRGPPMNNHPGGVWYRGGHPYGTPMGPRGFLMDPFPYYPPQVPPAVLTSTRTVPGHGAGPRVNHSKNGDMCGHPMPDSFVHPRMPIRPGFYPGPVPYEGYYGPPLGYCNPNNRDVPFAGMSAGPCGYNKHSGHGGYNPTGRSLAPEKVKPGHFQETRGPYKVLLKSHDGQTRKDEGKWEESVTNRVPDSEKVARWRPSSNDDQRAELRNDIMEPGGSFAGSDAPPCTWEGGSSEKVKSPEHHVKFEAENDIPANMEEAGPAGNHSLIQKIEGLNAKVRTKTIDGRQNVSSIIGREEQGNVVNSDNPVKVPMETRSTQSKTSKKPGSRGPGELVTIKNTELLTVSGAVISRSAQGIPDHENIERVINEDDGWRKKVAIPGSSNAMSAANLEGTSNVLICDSFNSASVQKLLDYPLRKNEQESGTSVDSNDSQRFWMRGLAKQRALQRQKEEERAGGRGPKALAKLEELNRCTQAVGNDSIKKVEDASGVSIPDKPEDPGYISKPPLPMSSDTVAAEDALSSVEANTSVAANKSERPSGERRRSRMTSTKDANEMDAAQQDNLPCFLDGGASKQKRMGNKQNQYPVFQKKAAGNSRSIGTTEAIVVPSPEVVFSEVASNHASNVPAAPSISTESTQLRRKNNKNGKKKHKVEETSFVNSSVQAVGKETHFGDESMESERTKIPEMDLGSGSVPHPTGSKEPAVSAEQRTSLPNEEAQGRANNRGRSQHSHSIQRNLPENKPAEKSHGADAVVWAPVRVHHKPDTTDEAGQKNFTESVSSTRSVKQAQSNPRSKRSEIERYVPKPIAKDMSQQGVSEKVAAATEMLENAARKDNTGSEVTEISQPSGKTTENSDARYGNVRQSKHGKGHGSWRQRGSAESSKASEDSLFSKSKEIVQNSVNNHQHPPAVKNDKGSVRDQTSSQDEWSGGWSKIPESQNCSAEKHYSTAHAISVGRDQDTIICSKQQAFRGSKGRGSNYGDQKRASSGDLNKVYMQRSGSELRADLPAVSNENRSRGERPASHWQPKTHPCFASNQHPGKSDGAESTRVEAGRTNKDSSALSVHQSLSDNSNTEDAHRDEHQWPTREHKMTSLGRQCHSERRAPVDREAQSRKNPNSGFKDTAQIRRVGRGHESRGDWSSSSQDEWHHHRPPSNRDKQRHNFHYEYQPVGAHGNPEQSKEGSHNSVPTYWEKGQQGHQRHGGERFHQQQRGNSRGN